MSDHGPPLIKIEGSKCSKKHYAGGENVTESGGRLNQWKRGNCSQQRQRGRDRAHSAQQRKDRLQQERQCINQFPPTGGLNSH